MKFRKMGCYIRLQCFRENRFCIGADWLSVIFKLSCAKIVYLYLSLYATFLKLKYKTRGDKGLGMNMTFN